VLTVKSGDTVGDSDAHHEQSEAAGDAAFLRIRSSQSLRDITDQVKDKGPGGHILTGPVYIEGAEPATPRSKNSRGEMALPYAYNAFGPGRGYLPDDYPYVEKSKSSAR